MNRESRSRDVTAGWLFGAVLLVVLVAVTWELRVSPAFHDLAGAIRTLARHDARLRDWAEVGRYREANRSIAVPGGRERVVFLGDSITDFWQLPRSGGFFPGRPYINRGIWGQTSGQMLVRFRPDVLDLRPAAVVIQAGTNDIAGNGGPMTDEEIEANIESMNELASAHRVRVIFASLLPVSEFRRRQNESEPPQTLQRPTGRLKAINTWLKSYAASSGGVYLDYFSSMVDAAGNLRAEFSDDDLHPNARGYAVMAPLAEEAIERALR
jgi:lysophospholipase L1-like esterase